MKNLRSWLRTIILLVCILSVTACTVTLSFCEPSNSYTLIWHPGVSGFPDVTLTLTPVIPPKALDAKPSSYVQVDLKVGSNFEFSTNDPKYQCLETIAATVLPILLAPENEVIGGFTAVSDFLVVYQACGQFVQRPPAKLASLGGIAGKALIFFQATGQKLVSTANGQELSPLNLPQSSTVTPSITPTQITPTPPPPMLTVIPTRFNGNKACSYGANNGWTCSATLSSSSNNQGNLNWSASSSGLPGISFSQPNGTLSPGRSQPVEIFVPAVTICPVTANLIFSGPANTVTVPWSCAAPTLKVSPTSLDPRSCKSVQGSWTCTVMLSDDEGGANWTSQSNVGATFSPASDTVYPSGETVTITIPNTNCVNGNGQGTITFSQALGGNSATVSWFGLCIT